jgi:two-component system, response regulator
LARDVELTLRAFRTTSLGNETVGARDGVEALDYLFGTGAQAARDVVHRLGLYWLVVNQPPPG